MPLKLIKNPDPLINNIINELEGNLIKLRNNSESAVEGVVVTKDDLHTVKLLADNFLNVLEIKFKDTLPEHLDERTELKDILETVIGLEHVIKLLLPGRVKYIIKQLGEIRTKNTSEILRFVTEQ